MLSLVLVTCWYAKKHALLAEIGHLRSTRRQCREKCDKLADAWEMERAKTEKASGVLGDATTDLAILQEEIDADYLPEGAQPPARIQKRDRQALIVGQLEAALEAQKRSTTRANDALKIAERRLFEADRDLHVCVDRMEDAEAKVKIQKELDMDRTERLVKKEYERSEKWQKEQISAVQKRSDNIKTLSKRAENQITQAKIGHANALKKLQKTKAERTVLIEEMDELEKAHQADRLEAVLQTKADTDMARIKAAKDSDQHQKKLARAAQELEDEKEILLAKGKILTQSFGAENLKVMPRNKRGTCASQLE